MQSLAGVAPPAWQTAHEVRTSPATVVVASEWMSASEPPWQPDAAHALFAEATLWALSMLPCIGLVDDDVWQPPWAHFERSQFGVSESRGLGWHFVQSDPWMSVSTVWVWHSAQAWEPKLLPWIEIAASAGAER